MIGRRRSGVGKNVECASTAPSYEIPVVGWELTPSVLYRRPDNAITSDDVSESESAPVDGYYLRFRWYRIIQSDKKVAVCSVHPSELATVQCMECVKAKIPVSKSFHCSPKCYSDSWGHHRALHARAASAVHENETGDDELFGRLGSTGGLVGSTSSSGIHNASLSNGSALLNPPNVSERGGDETWYEVGRSKTYTPTVDDVGYALKLECVAVDAATRIPVGPTNTLHSSLVIPAPSPAPRRMIPINALNGIANLELEGHTAASGRIPMKAHGSLLA